MASSFAFMSSPTHSPNSSMILPSMADPVAMSEMSELLAQTGALSESDCDSLPTSPRLLETPPAFATTPPHLKRLKYRVLTIHLEKEDMIDWIVPVAGPYFKSNIMDITSSYLLGQWYELHSGDLDVSKMKTQLSFYPLITFIVESNGLFPFSSRKRTHPVHAKSCCHL